MATKREEIEAMADGHGCLGKAADNEPLFILRAQDVIAPQIVEEWIRVAQGYGTNTAKLDEARQLVMKMRAWPTRKIPD